MTTGGRAGGAGGGEDTTADCACGSSSHASAGALPTVGALKDADAPAYAFDVGRGVEGILGF